MGRGELLDILNAKQNDIARHHTVTPTRPPLGRLSGRAGGAGLAGWSVEDWLVVGRARSCSHWRRRAAGRGPEAEDLVGLTGLAAPALLGWSLRVTVGAWSVSVWVRPR